MPCWNQIPPDARTEACIGRPVPGAARADVVHVFSASYTSFLLAPLPAILVAKNLGRRVVLNTIAARRRPLRRSAWRDGAEVGVDVNAVPSPFLRDVWVLRHPAHVVSYHRSAQFSIGSATARPRLRRRATSSRLQVACVLRASPGFRRDGPTRRDARGGGKQEHALRAQVEDCGFVT